jgi:ABC-type nitrate/sulfonate/bicarbonate transport system substrate-binding protein
MVKGEKMSTKYATAIGIVFAIVIVLFFLFGNPATTGQVTHSSAENLKVGWMISWYDPGLLAEVLKNTGALEKNNSTAEMVSFNYGPPIVEAALAKGLNATFLGIVPSTVLLSKSDDWLIVARMITYQEVLVVRNDSNISTIADFKGKRLGVPFATGPHPAVIKALEDAGLTPGKDVELINIKPADLAAALGAKQIDGGAWDASLAFAVEQKGIGHQLAAFKDYGVIMVSKSYAKAHPEQVKNFLKAVKEADFFVAQNKKQAFEWYAKDSSFAISYIESLPLIEPNYSAENINQVDISLSKETIAELQDRADYLQKIGIISKHVDIASSIDQIYQ